MTGRRPRRLAAFLPLLPGTTGTMAIGAAAQTASAAGAQRAGRFETTAKRPASMKYLLHVPRGYAADGRDHFILDAHDDAEPYAWFLRHARAAAPP